MNGASQLSFIGVTIARIKKRNEEIASALPRNKKPRTISGPNIFESNTVMTYSTPKEFVCHHQY